MFARRRPLLRAAVVGGGAYVVGKRSRERAAEQSAQQSDQNQQQSGNGTPTTSNGQAGTGQQGRPAATTAKADAGQPPMTDQLKQLSDMHEQGALTDAEFAQAKSRLIGS